MTNLYKMISNQFVKELESGIIPWQKKWVILPDSENHSQRAYNRFTGRSYGVLNSMLLSNSGEYGTFEQWTDQKTGGKIRKGEHGQIVTCFKKSEPEEPKGKPEYKLRYYRVFPLDSVMNVSPTPVIEEESIGNLQEAERLVRSYIDREGITLEESETAKESSYDLETDVIRMPTLSQYECMAEYYSDFIKAMIASSRHSKRLNTGTNKKSDVNELAAEIAYNCILHGLGIETVVNLPELFSSTDKWIKRIKRNKYLIFSATSLAAKITTYIMKDYKMAKAS